jgi:hypothetical protein
MFVHVSFFLLNFSLEGRICGSYDNLFCISVCIISSSSLMRLLCIFFGDLMHRR